MQRIKTIQTRDCHYPIYEVKETNFNFHKGFYFFDAELEEMGARQGVYGPGYIGPFDTLDIVCKKQYQFYQSVMSL